MTVNQQWVMKEKELSEPSAVAVNFCPYFKKIFSVASYSADGQCLAGVGLAGMFCTANDIREYCLQGYHQCPVYKAVTAGERWEAQKEDDWNWPSL